MVELSEGQRLFKRSRISYAQSSEPVEEANSEFTSQFMEKMEKKDSAFSKNLCFSPDLPKDHGPAPVPPVETHAVQPRTPSPKPFTWNHKFRPVPNSDSEQPPTPEIDPFAPSTTYPDRLNLTQKLLDQALKTAKLEIEEQKQVNKGLQKDCVEAKKEVAEAKEKLAEIMILHTNGQKAAAVNMSL